MRLLFFWCLFLFVASLPAQTIITLFDKVNNRPIADALLFIDKTNYNLLSRSDGSLHIDSDLSREEVVNISHLNYEFEEFNLQDFASGDTLFLRLSEHQLSNVNVVAKSSRKRKRWLRQFEKDFLGVNAGKYKVNIENPEVILFKDAGTDLTAKSDRALVIHNEFLQYKINYWLGNYQSAKDGTVSYHGKYYIENLDRQDDKKISQRRLSVYNNSLEHLLQSIITNQYEDHFILKLGRIHQDGTIELLRKYDAQKTHHSGSNGKHEIRIIGILQVEHLSLKAKGIRRNLRDLSALGQRAEQDIIQHDRNTTYDVGQYERSYLFSRSGQVIFNDKGELLNSQDIKVYGYWGTLGMADVLPIQAAVSKLIDGKTEPDELDVFLDLMSGNEAAKKQALEYIDSNWDERFLAPSLDLLLLLRDPDTRRKLIKLLTEKTGHKGGNDYYNWLPYLWETNPPTASFYDELKAVLYGTLDPVFSEYFADRLDQSRIRMEEVVWGGVRQDGIPPLRQPEMIFADQAMYLDDSDIVFGLSIEGEYRAYPKRILGWHEFVTDKIAGRNVAGVYCTLCGTMIAYDMNHDGTFHDLGTSGFLYRSNKLMYDKATQSLWNTIEGKPVIGPLAGKEIVLKTYPVVTTTWGTWKKAHPSTLVLPIETGHTRNYDEGAAYREYYATDRLMFPVPKQDKRLRNKDEVVVIRNDGYEQDPVAISKGFLVKNNPFQVKINDKSLVVITDASGASRAYHSENHVFEKTNESLCYDSMGRAWQITEAALVHGNERLKRVPAHRIFWFAWHNAYPDTRLYK